MFHEPWSIDRKALDYLTSTVNAIKPGDDIHRVVDTIGIPDSDHFTDKNRKTHYLTYYVIRRESASANKLNKLVIIALDDSVRFGVFIQLSKTFPVRIGPTWRDNLAPGCTTMVTCPNGHIAHSCSILRGV